MFYDGHFSVLILYVNKYDPVITFVHCDASHVYLCSFMQLIFVM